MPTATMADNTVYRCGEAYSALAQCPDGHAAQPINTNSNANSEHPTHTPKPANTVKQDAREAQTLEAKRLQATAHQTTPTMPAPLAAPQQTSPSETAPNTEHSSAYGKHKRAGKPKSPYFTAKDTTTAPTKKKSNAKALPAKP